MANKDKILDKAQKYMLKGYLDKALVEYKSALAVDPRDISIRLRIGDLYIKTNSVSEAIKEYTEVAKANAQRGFYPKAIAVYKKILTLDDSSLDVHYKLAELYTKQRLIADAISSYSYIVSTFEKKGKTSEVMELLKKMLEIDPDNVGVRLKLADLFLKLSFEKDAVTEYAQIFEKLIADGKVDRAEKIFLALYNARPNEPVILKALAGIYRKKGDEVKYLNYARPLLKIYTHNEDVGNALALSKEILEVRHDDDAALEVARGIEPPELIHQEQSESPQETDFSVASSHTNDEKSGGGGGEARGEAVTGEAEQAADSPVISWPEEDIEVSIEGFDDEEAASAEPVEDAFKEEEEFVVIASDVPVEEEPVVEEPVQPVQIEEPAPVEEPAFEEHAPVEAAAEEPVAEEPVHIEEPAFEEQAPVEAAPEEPVEVEEAGHEPAPEEALIEESPAKEPVEPVHFEEPAPVEEPVEATASAPEAPAVAASYEDEEEEPEVEIDLGDYGMDRSASPASGQEPSLEQEAPVAGGAGDTVEIEEGRAPEGVLIEERSAEEPVAEVEEPVQPVQIEEPAFAPEAPVEHAAEEPVEIEEAQEESAAGEPAFVEEVEEPAAEVEEPVQIEEPAPAEEPVQIEEPAFAPDAPVEAAAEEPVEIEEAREEPAAGEPAPVEEAEEPVQIEEPAPAEEPVQIEEPAFAPEAPVEHAAEEPFEIEAAAEEREEIEEERAPEEVLIEEESPVEEPAEEPEAKETFEGIEVKFDEPIEDVIERVLADEPPFAVDMEDAPEPEMEAAAFEQAPSGGDDAGQAVEPPASEADDSSADIGIEDELSSAIEELQARMETDDMLLEPERVKVEESAPETEFIDLSAELGMEEALEGLAGTWTQNEGESTDAFDEYKDGIGHQLSKEDTETHYNLGIAYMEMELFDEASKEFKIALKEPRLEGDCYARLGLCAMAESKPDEAVMHYLKGLKVEGRSEDERKGMMYELALAYEAAGDTDEAFQLFTSINDLDPDYREVGEKLSCFERGRPYIPMDDGLMEVELL